MDWKNKLPNILNKFRTQLYSRRYDGMDKVYELFHECDVDSSGSLNRYEFQAFLSKVGLFMSSQEQAELFRYYDKNQDGNISVREFLNSLQETISDRRLSAVKHTWQILDQRKRGFIEVEELKRLYNENRHPRVITREKTKELVREEFENALRKYSEGRVMTEDGFLAYYANLSATLPLEQDHFFEALLTNTWDLNSRRNPVPDARLNEIEDLIYEKIRQRIRGDEDEGRAMQKTFRHFDKDNSGTITFEEFTKCLQHWGCAFDNQEARALFDKYDVDKSGTIVYEEFSGIFARRGAGDRHQFKPRRELPKALISKLKNDILKRGTIRDLETLLRRMDVNGDDYLTRHEFEWGLRENGHVLSPMDLDRLFRYFDINHDGKVSYQEFLDALKDDISQKRKDLIAMAYKKLETNSDGQVTLSGIRQNYNGTAHPEFRSGAKTRDQVLVEFMNKWGSVRANQAISLEDFENFYKDISANVKSDDDFEQMIRGAWSLAEE
ncbi:unnamed protein product [Blepharisma stoltei]|uniref:EF-hand domain-containing protein n=1 Tax=Blepharisma stoltei TaxID=1481888 RepID=A0AAU9JQG6_9CILI|nr:unnamed protein product [Blepharisma stoltei]